VSRSEVYFGGPGAPPGHLRDLLAERVAGVPEGGAIDWVTYYFRDRRLARELLRARRRGVSVRVTLDGTPRTPRANRAVIGILSGSEGLGSGLRIVRHPLDSTPLGKPWRPRLHEKIYCFSHPRPVAFVGSFNPSGDEPEEEPPVIREIGDQDRGYNVLVGLSQPSLVSALVAHARRMHAGHHGPLSRFSLAANRALEDGPLTIHFWPRLTPNPVVRFLRRLPPGSRVRIAASHVSGPGSVRALLALVRRGVRLEMLTESTLRRVPSAVEARLAAAGICIARVVYPEGLPMHDKFALIDAGEGRQVIFGSFNWTEPSRRFNREIGVVARDPELYHAFSQRWELLRGAC
jgi:phosphatidylserine/phosphatidylglycerophosphate/cardiolipin synthase-like enzyme